MSKLTALLVGDFEREEFRDARELLRCRSRLLMVPTMAHACALLEPTARTTSPAISPELIVLAQSRPGQYATGQIERLRRLAPLARVVGLLGSWCEGEPRTGRPWPAAMRYYWYDWTPRMSREFDQHDAGRCAMWSLPDTVSAEEQLGWACGKASPERRGRILVYARTRDMADALEEACRAQGYSAESWCHWLCQCSVAKHSPADGSITRPDTAPREKRLVASIWEGTQCGTHEVEQLRRLAHELPGIPILALLDFPRTDSRERALAGGAACVISKPFLLDDLFALLRMHVIR